MIILLGGKNVGRKDKNIYRLALLVKILYAVPEQACGGRGNIRVVELFLLATAQP